jgi:hypothetical protein
MSHATITIDGHTVTVTGPDAAGMAERLAAGGPTSGNWISADDYHNNVKALDAALNGPGGASRPSLIDILSQVEQLARERKMPVLAAIQAVPAVFEGWRWVPVEPSDALLRPFYECPADELKLAWQAMHMVSAKKLRAILSSAPQA